MIRLERLVNSPLILALVLYILLYSIRWQQSGWEPNTEVFKQQRIHLVEKIREFLPPTQSALLSGILLGIKQDLPVNLRLALRDTSTLHIVVASGQNLTILAGLILHLAGLIKRRTAIMLVLLLIGTYTILTGVQIPILRAAIMFSLAALAQLFGRQNDGFWVLIATACFLLLLNPKWVGDLSFQMSFLASFGVIVVAPILEKLMKNVPIIVRENLSVTLGAQIMVLPVIASNFHQLSLVSLLANLLVLWIVPYIMGTGFLLIFMGLIWQFAGQILGLLLNIMLTYFLYIVQFFASLPFAWEYVGEQVWVVWVGYYLVISGVLLTLNKIETKN